MAQIQGTPPKRRLLLTEVPRSRKNVMGGVEAARTQRAPSACLRRRTGTTELRVGAHAQSAQGGEMAEVRGNKTNTFMTLSSQSRQYLVRTRRITSRRLPIRKYSFERAREREREREREIEQTSCKEDKTTSDTGKEERQMKSTPFFSFPLHSKLNNPHQSQQPTGPPNVDSCFSLPSKRNSPQTLSKSTYRTRKRRLLFFFALQAEQPTDPVKVNLQDPQTSTPVFLCTLS